MKKLLIYILFVSTLYSDNNILIIDSKKNSNIVEMLIRGNGEECNLSVNNSGELLSTNCLQLTNSKNIKILCTKNKKICKTLKEVELAVQKIEYEPVQNYDASTLLIEGNGEVCKVVINNCGVLMNTTCLQMTNSKGIKILCTPKKKMCKTVDEVYSTLNKLISTSNTSNFKDFKLILDSKLENYSTSFDCGKASTQTEHDICNSDRVSTLDLELGNMYTSIENEMPRESFQNLIQIQRDWVKERDEKCGNQDDFSEREKCLIDEYNKRIDAFSLIGVMDSKMDHTKLAFQDIYDNGTSEERFTLSAYLYHKKNDINKATKLLRKIIADNQEDFYNAFIALNAIHKDYTKNFPQVSKKILKENYGSIGVSLWDLNATYDEVVSVLIEESYLLNSLAQITLRLKYEYPTEGEPAYDKRILSYYKECAEEGIPRCEEVLGKIYLNGLGVQQNIDQGIQLLKQSELGEAYLILAEYYYKSKDIEGCKKYSRKAAELGEVMGMHNLGILAQEENKHEEAFKYFKATLELDNKYYPSMMEISKYYLEGIGTEIDYEKAIEFLETIIKNSNDQEMQQNAVHNLSIAQFRLGINYLENKDANKTKAFILIKKSAENNNMYAQYKLATMYFNGEGVKKDENQVIKWYEKAAAQGHAEAQLYLSLRYLEGRGVEENHEKGLYWAKKSAEGKHIDGQYLYGTLLLDENKDEAINWLKKAADQGHKGAKEKLYEFSKSNESPVQNKNEPIPTVTTYQCITYERETLFSDMQPEKVSNREARANPNLIMTLTAGELEVIVSTDGGALDNKLRYFSTRENYDLYIGKNTSGDITIGIEPDGYKGNKNEIHAYYSEIRSMKSGVKLKMNCIKKTSPDITIQKSSLVSKSMFSSNKKVLRDCVISTMTLKKPDSTINWDADKMRRQGYGKDLIFDLHTATLGENTYKSQTKKQDSKFYNYIQESDEADKNQLTIILGDVNIAIIDGEEATVGLECLPSKR